MKVCYCITSDGQSDAFADMAYISASLVRRAEPHIKIVLLLDLQTAVALRQVEAPVLELADEIVEIETGLTHPVGRNRFLKTVMRQHVKGDFLYLDADALPVKSFAAAWQPPDWDIAGIPNRHRGSPYAHLPSKVASLYERLEWPIPKHPFINGGVLYWADTPVAHRLSEGYHRRWRTYTEATGDYHDQPALNSAIAVGDARLEVMSLRYNAMVESAPAFARDARIIHFSTRSGTPTTGTLLEYLVTHYCQTGEIDWQAVDRAANLGEAWPRKTGPATDRNSQLQLSYLRWGQQALQYHDFEAARRFAVECLQQEPLSSKNWKLLVRSLLKQTKI